MTTKTATKLHEILAVEKSRSNQATVLVADAEKKFGKPEYFSGHIKTLSMIVEDPANTALQNAAREEKTLPTTVHETLSYIFEHWNKAEDVIFTKNVTNQSAKSYIEFRGNVIVENVPVDELMGLEHRLADLRKLIAAVPTVSAGVRWSPSQSGRQGEWEQVNPEHTVKTEKVMTAVVLYEATEKHPAQIKEVSKDIIVGTFTKLTTSGAASSIQKSESLKVIDDLINAVKQARMRANSTEIVNGNIGKVLTDLIFKPFTE